MVIGGKWLASVAVFTGAGTAVAFGVACPANAQTRRASASEAASRQPGPDSQSSGTPSIPTSAVDAGQSAVDPGTPAADESHDIIVTALKRGTRIQETPISISAITSESLVNSGVQNIANLSARVPSLSFVDAGPSNRRVVIRGIQAAGEPLVGVYYDETPVTGAVGTASDAGSSTPELRLFDVERVEVLRGPQGTLYGSGSMGGTLRIIYKKPTDQLEGTVDATLSDTNGGGINHQENAVINLPVTQDLAIRAVGFYQKNHGYIDNTYLHIQDINSEESYGGRLMVRAKPTSRLTLDGSFFLNHSFVDTPSWILNDGTYNTSARTRLPVRDNVKLYTGTGVWDLGGLSATANVSYMDRQLSNVNDVSRYIQGLRTPGSCANLSNGRQPCGPASLTSFYALVDSESTSALLAEQDLHAFTSEFRLSSSGKRRLNWTAGVFYSRRKTHIDNGQYNADPISGIIIDPRQVDTLRHVDDTLKQIAGFAEVSFDVTSKLNLTGGVRVFKYTKNVVGDTTLPSILVGSVYAPATGVSSTENGSVFKANASYKFTPDIMLYAEVAQGFRPGGVNQVIGLAQSLTPYTADKLINYEAGLKTAFLHRHLIANIDVFQIDWKDIQVTGRTSNGAFSFITNAGKARVRGVEFETTLRPFTGLSVDANASYIDAVLTENQANSLVQGASLGLSGDRIPYVPRFSTGVGAQYDLPVGNDLNMLYRADFTHASGSYSDFRPTYVFTQHIDAYDLVNFRVGVETRTPNWGIYIFATNALNATAIVRKSLRGTDAGEVSATSAQPRTIGINVRKAFR